MANEEAEAAPAAAVEEKKSGGGLVKTIGIGFGLFFLFTAAQLVSGVVGCMTLPSMTPGCAAPVEAEADAGKPEKGKKAKKDEKPKGPPIYHAFDPPLVVSFQEQGTMRFLQATVEVMARDEESIKAVKTHTPVLRNNLLNTLSGKTFADMTSREGKEILRKECLVEVQKVLKANDSGEHPAVVEDLYFTSFVVQ